MQPEAELEERRDPAGDHDAARGRRDDARDQLQERALAGPVAPDDPDRLARKDLHRDVVERFELVVGHAALDPADRVLLERADPLAQHTVTDRHPFQTDRGRHVWNAKSSARWQK